ncbi:MAG: hypothetical protein E7258_08310 [Lachnospiraceae bacterium]|nr:hypothetical protein [Lachnospiraceae bacterium]
MWFKYVAIGMAFFFFAGEYINQNQGGYISQDQEEDTNQDYQESYDDIYEMLSLDEVEKSLESGGFSKNVNFRDVVDGLARGDSESVLSSLLIYLKSTISGELLANKALMIQLVSLVLIGSIFVNISGSFGNIFVSENGFYITYLIITSIMLTSFSLSLDIVSSSIEKILDLIKIIVPVYALAINFIGQASTSAGMYQIVLLGVWLVQVVILRFIIPMVKFYVIISLINNLNREDNFSKLSVLIKNLVSWLLKTIVVFVAGLNIIKSLIDPQIDALGRTMVTKIVSSIPGGGIMSVLTGTFLGTGMIIKNSIGLGGIILIIAVIMLPVIKTFLMMLVVRITGVMIQPIGDKRYVEGVEALADGMKLLLQTILSSAVLFMLTIAIMAYVTNGG